MKSINDLVAEAKTVCERYRAGRMERETVREWVLRLGAYPAPHGDRVRDAAEWFRLHNREPVSEDIVLGDIDRLEAISAP
ncbi:hypothetical protein CO659_04760 [Rhizobium sp. S9]|uniref:hypothetical protein n=1 Tax=unclassified Rhizobium TaxID=2613769 RepID=UPI000A2106E2|nr:MULTISPECIES: hypothetical protein [unclassified Rhizobium]ARO27194.1 hypothetical protein TAL182_PD00102 [Rhizobium sp. TAL182]PDS98900.1 hypothetical protein CO659_04760 [Rhizobium sp. S9]